MGARALFKMRPGRRKPTLRRYLGGAVLVGLGLYFYSLWHTHKNVSLVGLQTNAGRDAKEINSIIDHLEKEHALVQSLIADLEKDSKAMSGALSEAAAEASSQAIRKPKPKPPSPSSPMLPTKLKQPPPPPPPPQPLQPPITAANALPETEAIAPMTFSSPTSAGAASVLVVCGTDGSGTRRVVDTLTELGVLMVSEDPETFDIHGDRMGGWPVVVKPVLRLTRKLNYSPEEISTTQPALHQRLTAALSGLLQQAEADSHKPTSYKLAKGGALPLPAEVGTRGVKFGFKAPVAMALVPYWAHLVPHFKLLHVVRDGRDIAFSANQGPVEKFYQDMYSSGSAIPGLTPPLQAVRLWSDWNSQIHEWSRLRAQAPQLSQPGAQQSFGYFGLHSEDLVSEQVEQRFFAISSLAHWVGSNITDEKACCLALEDAEYLGSHDRTERAEVRNPNQHVSSKYGKWRGIVRSDPLLAKRLNELGRQGLKLLGYEPMRALVAPNAASASGFVCSRERQSSGEIICPKTEKPLPYDHKSFAAPGCSTVAATDYKGDGASDIRSVDAASGGVNSNDPTWCCRVCRSEQGCKAFTYDVGNQVCFMKRRKGVVVSSERTRMLVSGDVL